MASRRERAVREAMVVLCLVLAGSAARAQDTAPPESPPPAPFSSAQAIQLIQAGKLDEALAELERGLAESPSNAKLHYLKGFVLMGLKRPDDAAQAASQALANDPSFEGANLLLGRAQEELGQFEVALEHYRREREVAKTPAMQRDALLGLATVHIRLKQIPEATTALEEAIRVAPDHVGAMQELADLYRRQGKKAEADAMLGRVAALSSTDPQKLYKLGVERHSAGDLEVAATYLQKALQLDPNLADGHRQLAYTLVSLGRKDEAAEHLERYLELSPNADDPNVQSARTLLGELKAQAP